MLNTDIKVPLPAKGIVNVNSGNKTYVQYTVSAYRNATGKPTSRRVVIGKLDEQSGMLIPNRNYYEIYMGQPAHLSGTLKSTGTYSAFSAICKKTGLENKLSALFGERAAKLLTIAQYMLTEGNIMYYLPDYQEEKRTYCENSISSADASRLFESITKEEITAFFHLWGKIRKSKEYIAYDVTSFSSYGKRNIDLEWGYNRDKEKLPQINMGVYYGEESMLPLYYRVYPGSISDKAHLKYIMEDNDSINCKKARYIMDRGFYSGDNLRYLVEKNCRFIIALPGSLKYAKELVARHRDEIVNRSECVLGAGLPLGKAYEINELGFRMKVHIYYDSAKATAENNNLLDLLEHQENDLRLMEEPPDKKLHYDKYFFINRSKDGKLGFVRNYKAIDEEFVRSGFFLLAETDFTKTTAEVLETYRRRDVVEKCFDELKNELDMKRLHTQTRETTEGKLFVAFISLIVRSYMQNKLKAHLKSNGYTMKKVFVELGKIKSSYKSKTDDYMEINPLTKTQRDIFDVLNA
ncbi:MAG: transposase [Anaerovoracaceae bacterium]